MEIFKTNQTAINLTDNFLKKSNLSIENLELDLNLHNQNSDNYVSWNQLSEAFKFLIRSNSLDARRYLSAERLVNEIYYHHLRY